MDQLWNHRKFKLYDKVKPKRENDNWEEGYIDAITPGGKIRIRLKEDFKWCFEHEIVFSDEQIKKDEPKDNIKKFWEY